MNYIQKKLKMSNFTRSMRFIFVIFYFIYCRIVIFGSFCNCRDCCKDFRGQPEDEQEMDGVSFTKRNEYSLNKEEVTSKNKEEENKEEKEEKKEDIYALDIVYGPQKFLENRISQLLQERFYREIYKNPYSFYETCKKSFCVVGGEGNLEEAKGEMKVKTEECIKNFFNGIELINKEDLNNYEKIKPLATFFLSNEDYDNYINKCVEEEKENWQKTIVEKSKVNKILKGDKNFVTLLSDYVRTNGFNKNSENHHKEKIDEISSNLLKCKPYNGLTYRGTRLYDEKRDPIIKDDLGKWQAINVFIEKIKTGILKMEYITSFSSDMGVAGHFAAFIKNAKEAFNFVICNHINKTGVNIYEDYDKNIFELGLPEEKEILYPKGSKFKILGIHIKTLKTFGEGNILGSKMTFVNGTVIDLNPEKFKFDYPFIVIDVVQIK